MLKNQQNQLQVLQIFQTGSRKKVVSSTNCKQEIVVLILPKRKSSNNLVPFTLNILLKTLPAMVKRKGDRGFPYLKPLVALTHPLVLSFTKITKFLIDEHSLIQVLHLGLNRFLSSTWSKINFEDYRRQSTWSYSFSKSILKTNSSSLERLFSSTISFAINNVSKIYLP